MSGDGPGHEGREGSVADTIDQTSASDDSAVPPQRSSDETGSTTGSTKNSTDHVLSIAAIAVSLATLIFTATLEISKQELTQRQKLTETLEKLTLVDRELAQVLSADRPTTDLMAVTMTLSNRRMALLESADRLLEDVEDEVTPAEYALLAVSFAQSRDFERAEAYMGRFLEGDLTEFNRASGYRSLANLLSAYGAERADDVRRAYAKALEVLGTSTQPTHVSARVDALFFRSQFEKGLANWDLAVDDGLAAFREADYLPCWDERKHLKLQIIRVLQPLHSSQPEAFQGKLAAYSPAEMRCPGDPPLERFAHVGGGSPANPEHASPEDYVGDYVIDGRTFRISSTRDGLKLLSEGQPPYRLVEASAGGFHLALEGFSAVLELSSDGTMELGLTQPNGEFRGSRISQ